MTFYLSNLLQNIYSDLGQTPPNFGEFIATGGSATSFVNTDWGSLESPPETDSMKGMYAFVVRDSAGAGASPEGKYSLISAYNDSTHTGTIATVTDAIASGDKIMIAKQDLFPLNTVITRVNRALTELGTIQLVNTSITTTSETDYDLPAVLKNKPIVAMFYQDDISDHGNLVSDFEVENSTPGSVGRMFIPNPMSGYVLNIVYEGIHPTVASYNDTIAEVVHPSVATAASILSVLEWYNRRDENQGSNDYHLWLESEYRTKYLPMVLSAHPIVRHTKRSPRYSIFAQPITEPTLDSRNTGGRH